MDSWRAGVGPDRLGWRFAAFPTGLDDRRFVLGTDIAAIDQELAVVVDTDEDAGAGDVGRIEDLGPGLEGFECGFDFAEPLVHLVGQFVGILILRLELVVLGA